MMSEKFFFFCTIFCKKMTDKNLIDNEGITIESDDVVNKYQMAADVSNRMCCYI